MITNSQVFGGQVKEVTDTRTPLQRFRRLGLYYLLVANGHKISENMPADKMRKYAEAYEEELDFSKVSISQNQYGEFIVEKPTDITKAEREADKEFQEKRTEFKDMDWNALRAAAKEKGIAWKPGMSREDLEGALIGLAA